MEKPFLTLGPKEFLTGLSSSAHLGTRGIFYKADGITPLYDAGGTASPENGLLQAGPAPTDFSTGIVDNIIAGVEALQTNFSADNCLFLLGSSGHLYRKAAGAGAVTDLRAGTPITTPANGLVQWGPAGGTVYLWYWQNTQIGKWDLNGTYATGWTDAAYTGLTSTALHPVHKFVGNAYYGNYSNIGGLLDAGSGTVSHSANVLDLPVREVVTALTDDSIYLVIAATTNLSGANTFALNKIYFWDTFSASWSREHEIRDPFIYSLQSVGGLIYAFGQYGVYEGSFGGGFKKVLSRLIGFGTPSDLTLGYGSNRSLVYNGALVFATDTTVDSFGKLQPDVPTAHIKHFKIPAAVGTPTFMSGSLDAGRIYVATDGAKLYAYDFNSATHDSGNTAQTVYFSLPSKTQVNRIDVVFAEPLASGDSLSVSVYRDEDTAATSIGTASFAADGAKRRKMMTKTVECEEQLALLLTFTSGAVKVKRIEVYGQAMTP